MCQAGFTSSEHSHDLQLVCTNVYRYLDIVSSHPAVRLSVGSRGGLGLRPVSLVPSLLVLPAEMDHQRAL
jgi:hypothetical protein